MDASHGTNTSSTYSQTEYRSLRETIQHRGSLRVAIVLAAWSVWAALALWSWTSGTVVLAGAIPLLVLVGGFEIGLSLHTGVERVGRYIQAVYESGDANPPAWEHVAMSVGSKWLSPGGLDPLFGNVFLAAALLNALPAFANGSMVETAAAAAIHAAFAIRVAQAQRFVKLQRAHDLAALQQVISSNSLVSRIQQSR